MSAAAAGAARPAAAAGARPAETLVARWRRRLVRRLRRLDASVSSLSLVAATTSMLLVLGLVMVLSSSSVESIEAEGTPWLIAGRQLVFAAIGVPLMLVAASLPARWWPKLGWPLLGLALLAQGLVFTGLGFSVNGNRNWLRVADGLGVQPAEALKLGLVVWAAAVLARKRHLLARLDHVLVPVVVPVGLLAVGLVLAGQDLGTAIILLLVLGGLLFGAGVPMRFFAVGGTVAALALLAFVQARGNRVDRIQAWLSGGDYCAQSDNYVGICWQSTHGLWALATGGWWGVGLGGSREKWAWLPEAHNDFIFAIIGEELGLPGTLFVLGLFVALAASLVRVALRASDPFVVIATTGVLAWVVGQALVNIGVVIGLLPVFGVPLPLVSSGGSSLIMTMVALGMVMSFARAETRTAGTAAPRAVDARLPRLPRQRPSGGPGTARRSGDPGGQRSGTAGQRPGPASRGSGSASGGSGSASQRSGAPRGGRAPTGRGGRGTGASARRPRPPHRRGAASSSRRSTS